VTRAPTDQPSVSVVVPVRDGVGTIGDCIDAILATHYPADRREILIVDNASTDDTAAQIHSRPVRYLREPRPGVSNARNRGIAESTGEILAFVDADCLVEPQWLTELVRPFEDPEVGAVGGNLEHVSATTPAERQAARMLGNWQQFAFNSNPAYPITANAAYRREVIDRIGPFDPHMTRAQDVELGLRFQERSGRRLAFAENATARHRNRTTQLGFFRQQLGWGQVRGDGRPPGQAAPHQGDRPHRSRPRHRAHSECARPRRDPLDRGRLVRPDAPGRLVGGRPRRPAQRRPDLGDLTELGRVHGVPGSQKHDLGDEAVR
jgi:cellulose synthase/poly-beta-1,6-N-acetylglucosamine synthase-like glycosyltransferase